MVRNSIGLLIADFTSTWSQAALDAFFCQESCIRSTRIIGDGSEKTKLLSVTFFGFLRVAEPIVIDCKIEVVGKGGSTEVGGVNGVDTPLKGAEKEGKAEEKRD